MYCSCNAKSLKLETNKKGVFMEKHKGSCHCGAIQYEVEMSIQEGTSCNCSICQRKGTILGFAPEANFKLISGKENLRDYQFNKKTIHHVFCSTCGISSFSSGKAPDGTSMVAINLRCLENIDLSKIKVNLYDGRSL